MTKEPSIRSSLDRNAWCCCSAVSGSAKPPWPAQQSGVPDERHTRDTDPHKPGLCFRAELQAYLAPAASQTAWE